MLASHVSDSSTRHRESSEKVCCIVCEAEMHERLDMMNADHIHKSILMTRIKDDRSHVVMAGYPRRDFDLLSPDPRMRSCINASTSLDSRSVP
jgi:hypothetical protein